MRLRYPVLIPPGLTAATAWTETLFLAGWQKRL